ncbi:MAG: EAL domain-containing protein [Deltaproteobacteria bacterium]|nr:EAL domain-containing protein [Deltaproteobacteria bacterium]MBW2415976.1 EAL domain-containing protein [Deltaproteobacteria bacterium]
MTRPEASDALMGASIMMVDDESTTTEVLQMFLEGEGYSNFTSVSDARRALSLLRSNPPDVLLLDLMMPHIGGLEILTEIRGDEDLQHIPVIILTASTDGDTKLKALELGATDFLAKPVDPSELALRLRNTLAAKAYRDWLIFRDALTGLPNRRLFNDRLKRALERAAADDNACALVHINIDRFKRINETLGQAAADALLQAVASRLEKCVRATDLASNPELRPYDCPLSRVGGDEFSLLVPDVSPEGAASVGRRIVQALGDPFTVDGHELFLTCSTGISLFPEDGVDAAALLRNADVALSQAKRAGGNQCQFFSKSLGSAFLERLSLENGLQQAIERDELVLYYQPKIDIASDRIVGAEALMRWQHPTLGIILPTKFIPIAEETDLIESLGDWALLVACRQCKEWSDAGFETVRMSVNVSSKQFQTGALPRKVGAAISESGIDPTHLVLELTESMIMLDFDRTSEMLHRIKEMGVRISIDDFGTGYSSLATLSQFPLDELKIDCSFVSQVTTDAQGAAIVTATIGMAHALGLTVVAEGVETEAQLEFLRQRGCEEFQGFLRSRPVPALEWASLLLSRTS